MPDRTSSSITVDAPPADVMAVIADFPRYPEWADGIKETEVIAPGAGGRAERVRFTLDAGVISDSYVLAYTWDDDGSVEWELSEAGKIVSGMNGAYRLTGAGARTEVLYELAVDVTIPLPGLLKRQAEKTIIGTALKGLKNRVESGH